MKKALLTILAVLLMLTLIAACSQSPADTQTHSADGIGAASETQITPTPVPASQTVPTTVPPSDDTPAPPPASDFDTDRVIAVFTREDGSGTRDAFVSITGVGNDMYAEAVVISETNEILTKVEENDYAISYVSLGSLSDKVKALNIDGVVPSAATIKNGSYTLQRPFLVCVNAENAENELVQDFIKFMLSAQGQELSASKWFSSNENAPAYSPGGLTGILKVGGSTSVDPLMQSLRQEYIALNSGVEIEISGGGSGTGISEATSGVLNIGMSSRGLRDNEKETLDDIVIALDGVAVIVNPANPIAEMSIEQVKNIFTGEVTRWSGVE